MLKQLFVFNAPKSNSASRQKSEAGPLRFYATFLRSHSLVIQSRTKCSEGSRVHPLMFSLLYALEILLRNAPLDDIMGKSKFSHIIRISNTNERSDVTAS